MTMTHPIIIGLDVFVMLAQRKYEVVAHPLADSRYSNTAVTLIEQSHVYSCMLLQKTKQTSILKIINLEIK